MDRMWMSQRPERRCSMHHVWHDLLFLHWEVPVHSLQAMLPKDLTVDTFEGKAYVGLVPFRISDIRARGLPSIPGFSQLLEINVRTYVHRHGKDPGVWFFSLDAANPFACLGARLCYWLPYYFAQISLSDVCLDGRTTTEYRSRRYIPRPVPAFATIDYTVIEQTTTTARLGSLDHFFVERYLLYSSDGHKTYTGQVHHKPYQLQSAKIERLEENLIAAAGLGREATQPQVHFSRRVDVDIYPILPVDGGEVN